MQKNEQTFFSTKISTANGLINTLLTRLEFLSREVKEDRAHLFLVMMLYMGSLFCMTVGLVIAVTLSIYQSWDKNEVDFFYFVAGLFILFGVGIFGLAFYKASHEPLSLSGSLQNLRDDIENIDVN